uniref:Uncharacterized protein n=1 Tax=viral metagenome TaxID=1070528 RepID=A0A6C0D105_9ZZZZ
MKEEKDGFIFLEIPNWENNLMFPFPPTHEISGYLYRPFQSLDLVAVYIDPMEEEGPMISTKFRFHNQVEEWSKEEKDRLFKNQYKGDWIFFHTHPLDVYLRFQAVYAFPSIRDISNFFLHGLEDKTSTKYQELIWTVEGIYHLRLYYPFSCLPSTEEEAIDILRIQHYQNLVNDLADIWKSKETIEFFKRSETRPCDFCWWLQTTFRKLSQKFDLSNDYLGCSFLPKK